MRIIATIILLTQALGYPVYSETSPKEACIFFFNRFGPEIKQMDVDEPVVITEMGEVSAIELDLSRYLILTWPSGVAMRYGESTSQAVDGDIIELAKMSFKLKCLVDQAERRVLEISISNGSDAGKPIILNRATGPREFRIQLVEPRSISMLQTSMRGLY